MLEVSWSSQFGLQREELVVGAAIEEHFCARGVEVSIGRQQLRSLFIGGFTYGADELDFDACVL